MKTIAPLVASLALILTLAAADAEKGFKSIFNGKDLTGWEGNKDLWSVEDGCITGRTPADPANEKKSILAHNTFLVWKAGTVADFELRFSYRIVAGNSGVQYRSKTLEPGKFGPIISGYQADFEAGKTHSGILYEEKGRGILARRGEKTVIHPGEGKKPEIEVTGTVGKSEEIQDSIKPEDWNDYVIIAQGNHLQHFINGRQTIDVTDKDTANAAKSGLLALQIHQGPPMLVQFKNLRIKELKGETKTVKSDLKSLQGDWKPVEVVANGEPVEAEAFARIKYSITGNEYTLNLKDGEDGGSFKLVESHSPKWMDITTKKGDFVPAIYEFKGGALRVCYALNGAARPEDFTTTAGSNRILAVYQRAQQ
ncbi:MAG: DUF1080 domain-containing protein [Verrucomicrobia bacterium]|nr:DUF1080 domain-containing protein [Verrucomicrobiota bacterium]